MEVGKVMRYFACECGLSFNEFVNRDTSDLKPTAKTGVYRVIIGQKSKPEVATCKDCGKQVEASLDPKGSQTKFLFNFME